MKKVLLLAAAAVVAMSANAQQAVEHTNFSDNWSFGLTGGVATPLNKNNVVGHYSFFGSMRANVGADLHKQISYVFGAGVEANWGINTSAWRAPRGGHSLTAFDDSYVGAYATVSLSNLFLGYSCEPRKFGLDAVLGAGWGHLYNNAHSYDVNEGGATVRVDETPDWNYFATKVGLNINYNVIPQLTLSLRPAIVWNMTDTDVAQTSCAYNANNATFNLSLGVTYNFGKGFPCVTCPPDMSAEVAALNARVNELRGMLDAATALAAANQAKADALAAELEACRNRAPEVVKEVNNNLQSVRYVFFKIGKHNITADQMPNVEMVAAYMKNHPNSKVVVKGYASQDGNLDFNIKLAANRAKAVRDALVNKYKVAADRVVAEGEGIGHMFSEESWNRVAICTLED